MKTIKLIFIAAFMAIFSSCARAPIEEVPPPATTDVPTLTATPVITDTPSPAPTPTPEPTPTPSATPFERKSVMTSPKIVIRKSERALYVYDGNELCAKMKAALGSSPEGHKTKEGDGKTPEGEYYICSRNDESKYYLSLGISYPNIEDAQAALDAKRIRQKDFDLIKEAITKGNRPPWDTALGGEIMIHGSDASSDWTGGCIAVGKEDIEYLWDNCPKGTPVIIYP